MGFLCGGYWSMGLSMQFVYGGMCGSMVWVLQVSLSYGSFGDLRVEV